MFDPVSARRLQTPAAAKNLDLAESTLEKKRLTGDGPPIIRLCPRGAIVYDTRDLDAWLPGRRVGSRSEGGAS
jgi:hypothetical protein